MVREADRLNRVISDLLFLGRPKTIAPKEVELAGLVGEIRSLLRFDLENRHVEIIVHLDAPSVHADPDALKQALLNLILNSLDALDSEQSPKTRSMQMPLLAGLTIRKADEEPRSDSNGAHTPPAEDADMPPASSPEESAGERSPSPGAPGGTATGAPPVLAVEQPVLPDPMPSSPLRVLSGYTAGGVWLEVQDNGCGMTEEQKTQAFEAFFTAKERGTGLGLALVQRTMLDHGGAAFIASEPGRGCVVRLFFPEAAL